MEVTPAGMISGLKSAPHNLSRTWSHIPSRTSSKGVGCAGLWVTGRWFWWGGRAAISTYEGVRTGRVAFEAPVACALFWIEGALGRRKQVLDRPKRLAF